MVLMLVGERLADLRKDKGLQQKELAAIIGVTERSVSLYERELSSPNDKIKLKIARYFNVSLDYLMGLTDHQISYDHNDYIALPQGYVPKLKKELLNHLDLLKIKYKLAPMPGKRKK
jgi:transcriptional regulator with XRE-family HTH domain